MISSEDRIVDDSRAMADTELQLTTHNPEVSAGVIHTLVQDSYHRLTPAKVHRYLPILVARDVQATLRPGHAA